MKSTLLLTNQKFLFFIIFTLFIATALAITLTDTKVNCFIKLNALHSKWLDIFFIGITYMGDGSLCVLISIIIMLIWRRYRLGVQVLLAYLVSGITAQLLKQFFLAPRPKAIISDSAYHFFINGITHSGWNSFPSGHTTSIFAVVTILILFLRNSAACFFLLMLAMLVGYSRIYLGQHFLEDVIAGALLGVFTGVLVYHITLKKKWPFHRMNLKRKETGENSYSS